MGRQLRLPGFKEKQLTGGEVEKGRGKKSKRAGWHLTLGLKEAIFAGIGVVGLMMMSFALGALAGRGDIYRAASSWGLMSPEAPKVAQWTPANGVTGGPPATAPAAPGGPEGVPGSLPPAAVASGSTPAVVPSAQTPTIAPGPVTVAAKPEPPAPVTGSIAPLAPPIAPVTAKKKDKTAAGPKDPKAREEELRKVRQEVVKKLKFQNSFDTAPKPKHSKPKESEKAQAKAKSQPSQIRVAEYRTSKEAQAKMAELQKKGVKATLKKSKDSKGTLYIVCKPGSPTPADSEKLVKKPEKSPSAAKKPAE
ncbi:MAG: hypothetical protein ACOZFS_00640 [Thermodesulfobacteriota bacterium]